MYARLAYNFLNRETLNLHFFNIKKLIFFHKILNFYFLFQILFIGVQEKQSENPRQAEEALFYFGKHYLLSQPNERDVIISGVSQFIVHPSYDPRAVSYDADIAMAVLLRSIVFTNFIRPICIWTATKNFNDIVDQNGVVAGK